MFVGSFTETTNTFSFGHCVVCSSIYKFWLPLWYFPNSSLQQLSFHQFVQWQYTTKKIYPDSSGIRKRTRQMYPYSSVVRNRTRQMCPYFSAVIYRTRQTTREYEYICLVLFVTTRGTDTFVLYVTDYTGVRIHLSCTLLTTPVLQCSQ
jgi:hypothetical protein